MSEVWVRFVREARMKDVAGGLDFSLGGRGALVGAECLGR